MEPEAVYAKQNKGSLFGLSRKRFEKGTGSGAVVMLCLALAVITLAVYAQVAHHQFLSFDDDVYVTENLHVAGGISGENIRWAFASTEASNWHPVTWLSHMLDVQMFGMNPCGHHLTNVAVHTVSSLLVLLLFVRMTGALWQSIFVAALFALHPLHVESVAWVAERKDVLSAFFWFLTLIYYTEYAAKPKISRYVFALTFFILGLMSKPMLVTLPLVMLLMDFWPLQRYREETPLLRQLLSLLKEKIPFFACSLLSSLVTIYAQNSGKSIASLNVVPFLIRCENALVSYVMYIGKTLWPHDLAVLYPFKLAIPVWQIGCSTVILLLITAVALRTWRRCPYLAAGWFWFLITLLPVIGLIQVGAQSMADRYSYIPSIGLFTMAAWGIPDLARVRRNQRIALTFLATAVLVVSTVLTWRQIGYWRNNITLYRHTLQATTGNYMIHDNLGHALQVEGNLDAAIEEFQKSLRIKFSHASAHNNLGTALYAKELYDAAIQEYRLALQISPDNTNAHNNLGAALTSKGYLDAAIQEYQRALTLDPDNKDAHNNLGVVFARRGDYDAAIREYQEALRISPGLVDARNNLEQVIALKRGR